MNDHHGYIYLRIYRLFDEYDVCLLGKTTNLRKTNSNYMMNDYVNSSFALVIQIDINLVDYIENELKKKFIQYNLKDEPEFYSIRIKNLIVPYLQHEKIEFKILSKNEINFLAGYSYCLF